MSNFLFQSLPIFDYTYDNSILKLLASHTSKQLLLLDLLNDNDKSDELLFPFEREFDVKGLSTSDGSSVFKKWYVRKNNRKYNRIFFNITDIIFDHSSHNLKIISSCGLKSNFFLSPFEFFRFSDLPLSVSDDFFFFNWLSKRNLGYPFLSITARYVSKHCRQNPFRIGKVGLLETTYIPLFNDFFFDDSDSFFSRILLRLNLDFFGGFFLSPKFFSNWFIFEPIKKDFNIFSFFDFLPFFSFRWSVTSFSFMRFFSFYSCSSSFSHEGLLNFCKHLLFFKQGFKYLLVRNFKSNITRRKRRFFSYFTTLDSSSNFFFFRRKFPFFFDNTLLYSQKLGPSIVSFFLGTIIDPTFYLNDFFESSSGFNNCRFSRHISLSWDISFSRAKSLLFFFLENFSSVFCVNVCSFFFQAFVSRLILLFTAFFRSDVDSFVPFFSSFMYRDFLDDRKLIFSKKFFFFDSVGFFYNFCFFVSSKSSKLTFFNRLSFTRLNIFLSPSCSDSFFVQKFNVPFSGPLFFLNRVFPDLFKLSSFLFGFIKYLVFVNHFILNRSHFLGVFYSLVLKSKPIAALSPSFLSLNEKLGIIVQKVKKFFEGDYFFLKNYIKFNLVYFLWFLTGKFSLFENELVGDDFSFFLRRRFLLLQWFLGSITNKVNLNLTYFGCVRFFDFFFSHFFYYYRSIFNLIRFKFEGSYFPVGDFLSFSNNNKEMFSASTSKLDVILKGAFNELLDKKLHSFDKKEHSIDSFSKEEKQHSNIKHNFGKVKQFKYNYKFFNLDRKKKK
jgi:hypothetical protein